MSFINWGQETPEQKEARRKFEEEHMMFVLEQKAANAATAAAAAASAGGSISGQRYCGGEKKLSEAIYLELDLLTSDLFKPSDSDYATFSQEEDDVEADWRASREAFNKAQFATITALAFGRISRVEELPEPPAPTLVRYKSIKMKSPITMWKEVDLMEGWNDVRPSTGFSPAQKMPGVKYFNFLNEVELVSELPNTGTPGDFIYCIETDLWYGWDDDLSKFAHSFAQLYGEDFIFPMESMLGSSIKSKQELIFASAPFLLANKYILDYKIKNKF